MKQTKHRDVDLLAVVFRLVLGITFIWASYHKIQDPSAFARILFGYAVFPDFTINILAITIPFVELTAGFSIIMGLFPRSALLILNTLLLLFIVVISFNLIRGHQFDCGCFSGALGSSTTANMAALVRDILLLGGGILLFRRLKAS